MDESKKTAEDYLFPSVSGQVIGEKLIKKRGIDKIFQDYFETLQKILIEDSTSTHKQELIRNIFMLEGAKRNIFEGDKCNLCGIDKKNDVSDNDYYRIVIIIHYDVIHKTAGFNENKSTKDSVLISLRADKRLIFEQIDEDITEKTADEIYQLVADYLNCMVYMKTEEIAET